MASGMILFERNDNHIELACVINRKLSTQMTIYCLLTDGAAVCIWNYPPYAILKTFKSELVFRKVFKLNTQLC